MASSPFERQVIDGDTEVSESPAKALYDDGPQQFAPSPSFVDRDRPDVRLVELPAWLQSFAASVGEPAKDPGATVTEQRQVEEPVRTSDTDNLRGQEPDSKSPPSASTPSNSSFISEDDLPEWLRAIAPDESSENSTGLLFGATDSATPLDDSEITVPNVSRAWSNSKDSRGTDEATSLFALVASQTPQAALPADEVDSELLGRRRRQVDTTELGTGGAIPDSGAAGRLAPDLELPASAEQPENKGKKFALPILPVAIAALLLIVLIAAAVALFVL